MHSFQMTFAQLAGMCKGCCICLPLLDFIVHFLEKGIHVAELLYVSLDTLIIELPSGLDKVVVHGRWPQEDSLEPRRKRFNRFGSQVGLCVDFEDVRRGAWAIVITETSNGAFIQKLDPFDRTV